MADAQGSGLVKWLTESGQRIGSVVRGARVQKQGRSVVVSEHADGGGCTLTSTDFLVYDPTNKARYLIPPIMCDTTAGKQDYAEKRQSFLCMLHQDAQPGVRRCNTARACNQLHVDRAAIRLLREEAAATHGRRCRQQHFVTELRGILDPASGSRIVVPYHRTEDSEGRGAYARGERRDYRLCMKHLDGSCRVGRQCPDIHARPGYVLRVRGGDPCCPFHNPQRTEAWAGQPFELRAKKSFKQPEYTTVPLCAVAITRGLQTLPETTTPDGTKVRQFAVGKVCRLHQENRCDFGTSCNNIHVCRSLLGVLNGATTAAKADAAVSVSSASSTSDCSVGPSDAGSEQRRRPAEVEECEAPPRLLEVSTPPTAPPVAVPLLAGGGFFPMFPFMPQPTVLPTWFVMPAADPVLAPQ
eukprot:TRINITY_DN7441_c0_g2_i1.p1 TRINITY_DN7441_c0_g2~~TRINITY_DN7441_c0_g2_i1.p1  ORF type:complete len:431 (+),score=124.11 TRINITY_DN7441_c0_g2_i1:59-1294(+)